MIEVISTSKKDETCLYAPDENTVGVIGNESSASLAFGALDPAAGRS